jgi:hypothetical protein
MERNYVVTAPIPPGNTDIANHATHPSTWNEYTVAVRPNLIEFD